MGRGPNQPNSGYSTNLLPRTDVPWALVWVLLLVLLGKVMVSLFIANQGFDLTDEGCYMLWYKYPTTDPNPFYYFHKMVLGFFPFIDWNIISLRILKIISDLSIIALVAFTVYRNLEAGLRNSKNLAFLIGLAGLGYYSIIYSRIFYEGDMSYLLTVLSLGIPLLFLNSGDKRKLLLGLALSGMFVGLQFFNKFSASILSFFIVVGLSVYLTRKAWGIAALLAGVAFGAVLFFLVTGYAPAVWYQEYQDGYKYVIESLGYNPLHLLIFYAIDGLVLLIMALLPLGAFSLIRFVGSKVGYWQYPHLIFALLLTGAYALYYMLLPHPFSDAHTQYQSMLLNYWYVPLVAVVLYLFFWVGKFKDYTKEERILLATLLLMPFVSLVGTGTSLAVSASAYLIPWFGILGLLLIKHFSKGLLPALSLVVAVVLGAFVYFHWQHPFRLNTPMAEQQDLLQAPNEDIYVDSSLADFVNETKAILEAQGVPSGYPIVALHNMPGLVYLLDGYSPATPWYFDAEWLNDPEYNGKLHHTNCLNIGRIKHLETKPPVFLINAYMLERVQECLNQHGFYLIGNDYYAPRPVVNPFVKRENALFGRDASDSMLVFVPTTFPLLH